MGKKSIELGQIRTTSSQQINTEMSNKTRQNACKILILKVLEISLEISVVGFG